MVTRTRLNVSCYRSDGVCLLRGSKRIFIVEANISFVFDARTVHVKFMVDKVAVEQIFLRAHSFSSVRIMPFLQEGQSGKGKERSKNIPVSDIRKHWTERYGRNPAAPCHGC
jgi:hypothetical protein